MVEAPLTRASLLVRIRDRRDQEAWQQFVHLYAPVVYVGCGAGGLTGCRLRYDRRKSRCLQSS
jgi:hypothetical protein